MDEPKQTAAAPAQSPADQLQSLLAAATVATEQLWDSLIQEREALVARDSERLSRAVKNKDQLVEQLTQLDLERRNAAASYDLWSAASADEADDTRLRVEAMQHELRRRLLACQSQNQVNGRLVQRGRRTVAELLRMMTGDGAQQVYGPSGDTGHQHSGRVLGKA